MEIDTLKKPESSSDIDKEVPSYPNSYYIKKSFNSAIYYILNISANRASCEKSFSPNPGKKVLKGHMRNPLRNWNGAETINSEKSD